MQKNKFRASYTVLSHWASGNWQRAIEQYFHLRDFVTPAMADGRDYHQKWADEIKKTGKMPEVFGGKPLGKNPIIEDKKRVEIYDWLDLSFIIDLYDKPVIYDWKTGKSSSESYASNMQIAVYGVGATYSGLYVERAEIHHFDQYTKKTDMSIVHITDKLLDEGLNWLVTLGGEMQTYLLQNGLYERFSANTTPLPHSPTDNSRLNSENRDTPLGVGEYEE